MGIAARFPAVAAAVLLGAALVPASAVAAPVTGPVAVGTGGAVVSDTPESTEAGLAVLRAGGTAADAAVAVAATLGVTDPYVAGLGGGGYLVYYDAKAHKVSTIDGRETALPAQGRTCSSTRRPASRSASPPPSPAAFRWGCRAC